MFFISHYIFKQTRALRLNSTFDLRASTLKDYVCKLQELFRLQENEIKSINLLTH